MSAPARMAGPSLAASQVLGDTPGTPGTSVHVLHGTAIRPGSAVQLCKVCGERFTGSEAGDLHRVVSEVYSIERNGRVLSVGNERRRCLSVAEMVGKGMARNARGEWQRGAAGRRTVPTSRPWDTSARMAVPSLTDSQAVAGTPLTPEPCEAVTHETAIRGAA